MKITQNVSLKFLIWHFPTIFVLLKFTCLVALFDRKIQSLKNSPKWAILAFLMNFFVHLKCKCSSLPSQFWMRLFTVIFKHCEIGVHLLFRKERKACSRWHKNSNPKMPYKINVARFARIFIKYLFIYFAILLFFRIYANVPLCVSRMYAAKTPVPCTSFGNSAIKITA